MSHKALVLIYHRVDNLELDTQLLAVSVNNFELQLKYLKSNYNVISLKQLVKDIINNTIQPNAIVITFDDGYVDNYVNAIPLLTKYNIPATIFITAGYVDKSVEFWWDQLERIFFISNDIFKTLEIKIKDTDYRWDIYTRSDAINVYEQMHSIFKSINSKEQANLLYELLSWANLPLEGRANYRSLNSNELKNISKNELIEIGAHTLTHCVLANESYENQMIEIKSSKAFLETFLNIEINAFSYPFGGLNDINDKTIEIVKKAGYKYAIANEQDIVTNFTDIFWLPRRLIRNWNIDEFKFKIDYFLNVSEKDLNQIGEETYKNQLLPLVKDFPEKKIKTKRITNVLQINTIDYIGGAAKIAFNLHKSYKKIGMQSKLLVSNATSKDEDVEVLMSDESKIQKLLYLYQRKEGWLDFFRNASLEIVNLDSFKNADIVHLHNLHGYYFSLFALPKLSSLKHTVWTLHDMQSFTGHCAHSFNCDRWKKSCGDCYHINTYPPINKDVTEFLISNKRMIYKHSDLTIVCPSKWLMNKVKESVLKEKDIHLIYNGIDVDVFYPVDKSLARNILNLPQDKKILLFSSFNGINNIWKGGKYLIELYKYLKTNDECLFINIGGDSTEIYHNNWLDIPYISDESVLNQYYSAADIFLYPSLADNCPLVVLESMACGTPVVTFDTGGIPELVLHNETGYIAKYKDLSDIINGVNQFLNNDILLNFAGQNSIKRVQSSFTEKQMVEKYLQLYRSIGLKV